MARAGSIIGMLAGAGTLCLAGGGFAAQADNAFLYDALTNCIDAQFERAPAPARFDQIDLAAECPEVLLGLIDSDWADHTALRTPDFLNLAQLADLRHFLIGAQVPPENSLPLDYSRLAPILADALDPADRHSERSWWQRFLDWLRQRRHGSDEADPRWLKELLDSLTLSKAAAENLAYGVAAVLILLAVALVVNEVRVARTGRPALRPLGRAPGRPRAVQGDEGTSSGIQQLPGKAPELLNLCISHLISIRRLPDSRSSTNREFLSYLRTNGDGAAPGFEYLLQQAEGVLYGSWRIDPSTLQQCRVAAAALLGVPPADDSGSPLLEARP